MVDETIHKAGLYLKYETDLTSDEIDYRILTDMGLFELRTGERSEKEQKIRTYLQQILAHGLFLIKITDVYVEISMTELVLSVRTESRIGIPWIKRFFQKYSNRIISGEYPIHNPAQTIRICEVILNTASKAKGVDELKNKIEKFFPNDEEH